MKSDRPSRFPSREWTQEKVLMGHEAVLLCPVERLEDPSGERFQRIRAQAEANGLNVFVRHGHLYAKKL